MTISTSLSGGYTETTAFAEGVDPFGYAFRTSRVIPCYDGEELFYYKDGGYNYNILNELANSGNENTTSNSRNAQDASPDFGGMNSESIVCWISHSKIQNCLSEESSLR